jgi:FKBP-type peptidyl-prolyl cis-trans isomerase FkpA
MTPRALSALLLAAPLALGCGKEASSTSPSTAASAEPKTEDDKTLYALGLSLGRSVGVFHLSAQELEFVKRGLTDSVTGQKPLVEIETYGPKLSALARSRVAAGATAEKEKSKTFLADQAKQPGAQTFPSGMVFIPEKEGTGEMPKPTDRVKVNYHGTLTNGTVFDSSVQRGQPATFPLNGVIPCWTEGLGHMKVGGKAKLICPSTIAYGDQGRPPTIPGGATLVFEVELLGIESGPPTGAPNPPNMPPNMPPGHPMMPMGHPPAGGTSPTH